MFQVRNATPFQAELLPLPDRDGIDALFTVVKGTFTLAGGVGVADEQVPVVLADEHFGEPGKSSVRAASEVGLGKPGTDVLLIGNAWAPHAQPAWQTDVSLAVGPMVKRARVFGDRVWRSGPAGTTMEWVAPFVTMPLVWERGFGGTDETDKGPTAEPLNPVGTGFRAPRSGRPLDGFRLPNIEDPQSLLTSAGDRPKPTGFGPVAANWQPRISFAGTYDAAWQASRAPYLPADFDPQFFHVAPAGLSTRTPLVGGEWVDVRGATPDGVLQFQLPALTVEVVHRVNGRVEKRPAHLETIIIEPDAARVVLVWRSSLRCDKEIRKVKEVEPLVRGLT